MQKFTVQVRTTLLNPLILAASLLFAATANAAPTYTALNLSTWFDFDSTPYDINEAGQVVGDLMTGDPIIAFVTGANGVGVMGLGTLGGYQSGGRGINASGQVVGWSGTQNGYAHAFITGVNGVGMTDLGTLGGSSSVATDINASGQVVGHSSRVANGENHAFITGPNGAGMTDLGTLGGLFSYATSINASGQVAGFASTVTGSDHAFITGPQGVGMFDLGTLGDATDTNSSSHAKGINIDGRVVGVSSTSSYSHAFITGPDGMNMTDLGVLPGGNFSDAFGINASGQVVGWGTTGGTNTFHAFVTHPDGVGMTDLNDLVTLENDYFYVAYGINDLGQIIARSSLGQAYLLTPVPEPKTYALILVGVGLVGYATRKRRSRI